MWKQYWGEQSGEISEKFQKNIFWQVAAFIHIQPNIENKNKSKSKEYITIQVKYLIF